MNDREKAEYLWELLDNIDTLDDACKGDDAAFRNATRDQQRMRFKIFESDGYKLFDPRR